MNDHRKTAESRTISPREGRASSREGARRSAAPLWLFVTLGLCVAVVVFFRRNDAAGEAGEELGGALADPVAPASPRQLVARVVRRYPHRPDAFTQGLLFHEGVLYESTGRRGLSELRLVDLATGSVRRRRALSERYFGEGLARVGERLVQLTWTSGRAIVFSRDDFEPVRELEYAGEGWGLCFDGERLVMSDGSAWLSFRDPDTFAEQQRVRVTHAGRPLGRLNELECVDGLVWANVWTTDEIVAIDPDRGEVTAVVDASGLLSREERAGTDVLNGIAWAQDRGHFLITGKLWPWLFEVDFVPAPSASVDADPASD